ncbi:Swarming motility protein ybiA [Termitomyces sp. T112]|nr:Swarming motility protein ybiA [Termitomyces sp. T112]
MPTPETMNCPLPNVRCERSPRRTSIPVASALQQRESKYLSSLNTFKSSSPNSSFPHEPSEILFYHSHEPYYGFTNFSNHPVVYKGKKYPTSEHLFQSFKFQDHKPDLAEHIRTCSERPSVAFSEARRFQPEVRPDWKEMDLVLQLKFNQHDDLRQQLFGTGNASLVEDSDKDAFWGVGHDRKGRNELGKALERLRTKLRTSSYGSMSPAIHNVQSTPTSPTSSAPQRVQFPGHNVNVQSPVVHGLQLRDTRLQVYSTYPPSQSMVQSPTYNPLSLGQVPKPLSYASPPRVQLTPHLVQTATTQTLTRYSEVPADKAHVLVQSAQSSILEVQAPEENRPPTELNSLTDHSLKPPNYDDIESSPADIAVKCRIPDCEKPVYYDGTMKSNYCSQQHRQEAVTRGLTDSCIKCLKMPQSETDYFCGRGCREESLKKDKAHSKI